MLAKARTWWTILRICLEERLVYRGDFALGTLMRFLPIVTQIFLWRAIFEATSGSSIAGYQYHELIASRGRFPACPAWPPASPCRSATAKSRSS
jgi:ABC-2 type transport system permease protein